MPAAAGCGFAYYGHSVKPALTLIIEPDEAGHPSPSAKLIGQALVQEMLPQWRSVLSMCLDQPDRMEYAPILQGLVLHASWVLRDGVVLDIQTDYIDLTRGEIVMPPQQPMPILPVQPNLHRHPVFRPLQAALLLLPAPPGFRVQGLGLQHLHAPTRARHPRFARCLA